MSQYDININQHWAWTKHQYPFFLLVLLTVNYFINARAAKEKTKAAKDKKKAAAAPAAKPAKTLSKSKAARPQKAAPRVGGKR